MNLPRLMIVTEPQSMRPNFQEALAAALRGGAPIIQLRAKDATGEEVLEWAQTSRALCKAAGAQLLINAELETAKKVEANGVHLPESHSAQIARQHLGPEYLLGQSVHTLTAARQAEQRGVDYIVFGSVFPTSSHPGAPAAGVEALREVVRAVSVPVFAIGGVTSKTALQCLQAGAHGIAVMSAVWQAPDVTQSVRDLNLALASSLQERHSA